MRHRTQFLPSRTFPPLPGSIGLGPSLSFQLSSCYHPRPLTPRFPCEGTCSTAFPVLRASAATLLTKLHATHQPPPPPRPSIPTPSSPLQSHQAILYTSCSKPSHSCTSTPSITYSSHFLESRPSISRNAIAFTSFSHLSLRPPFLLFCPRGKTLSFLSSCSFSTMPYFLFINIHLLSCFHPQ